MVTGRQTELTAQPACVPQALERSDLARGRAKRRLDEEPSGSVGVRAVVAPGGRWRGRRKVLAAAGGDEVARDFPGRVIDRMHIHIGLTLANYLDDIRGLECAYRP